MATRSGSGRTSSSLAKLTRFRVGTSWSGKSGSLPGGSGAHSSRTRWTARQTSSVRTPMACVNHSCRNPGWTGGHGTPFAGGGQPRRRADTPLTLDGCRAERRSSADADDRVFGCSLVDATHRPDHLGEREPEPAGLLLGSDRHSTLAQDVEELLHRRSFVTEQRGLRHVQGASQPVQRLDRRLDVSVLVPGQTGLGDPRQLLELGLGKPSRETSLAKPVAEMTPLVHICPLGRCGACCPAGNLTHGLHDVAGALQPNASKGEGAAGTRFPHSTTVRGVPLLDLDGCAHRLELLPRLVGLLLRHLL